MSDQEHFESTKEDKYSTKTPTKRKHKSLSMLRQPRQKFSPRWEKEFSWLRADKVDESLGVCTICNKQLVCKKSHLERHEKSFKHMRLNDSVMNDSSLPTNTEFLECGKHELIDVYYEENNDEDEFGHAMEESDDYKAGFNIKSSAKKTQSDIKKSAHILPQKRKISASVLSKQNSLKKLDRLQLLKQIDQDRHELNDYYYSRRKVPTPMANQRDPFDLFFESISASVKALPPKLAAEVKSRVSQIIAEFELRAICEREALEHAGLHIYGSNEITSALETRSVITTETDNIDTSAVPHIVYTFQPKYDD